MRDDHADTRAAQALEQALRRAMARHVPPVLDVDDLRQEGAIALHLARVDASRPEHEQRAYLRQRAEGAMIDAKRRMRPLPRPAGRAQPAHEPIDDDTELPALEPTQLGEASVARACHAVMRLAPPLPLIYCCRLAGLSQEHIAAYVGVSPGRISQLMARIRAVLANHLDTAAP